MPSLQQHGLISDLLLRAARRGVTNRYWPARIDTNIGSIVAYNDSFVVWVGGVERRRQWAVCPIENPLDTRLTLCEGDVATVLHDCRVIRAGRYDAEDSLRCDASSPAGAFVFRYADRHPSDRYGDWIHTEDGYLCRADNTCTCDGCGEAYRYLSDDEDHEYLCESCASWEREHREEERREEECGGIRDYSTDVMGELDCFRRCRGGDETAPVSQHATGWIGIELEVDSSAIEDLLESCEGVAIGCEDGSLNDATGVELKFPPASLAWYQAQDWQALLREATSPTKGYGLHIHCSTDGMSRPQLGRLLTMLLGGGSHRWHWLCGRYESGYVQFPADGATTADVWDCSIYAHYTAANLPGDHLEWRQPASSCRPERILARIEGLHALQAWCCDVATDSDVDADDCLFRFLRWVREGQSERYPHLVQREAIRFANAEEEEVSECA